MNQEEARQLLALARRDPVATLEEGRFALEVLTGDDPSVRAIIYRAMARAALTTDGPSVSTELAARALESAEASGDERLIVESLMTLGTSQAFTGDNETALQTLARAEDMSDGHLAAEVRFQLGTVQARRGESELAHELFSSALPVFTESGDEESVAMTFHNRGMLNLYGGDPESALSDFETAYEIETRLGMDVLAAGVEHNIGVATAFMGDLPAALEILDRSEARLVDLAESPVEVQVSRVEVLLSAGLFHEARRLSSRIAIELGRLTHGVDQAEAVLAGAEAARLAGDPEDAMTLARRAREMFEAQNRATWSSNARQVELSARLDTGEVTADDIKTARGLAETLAGGQSDAAFNARMTAGMIGLRCGLTHEAIRDLRVVAALDSGPVSRRLSSALAATLIHELEGDYEGAESSARAGMDLLDDYQAVLGASDVRAGVENHATQLGTAGLRLATRSGEPEAVWDWMERTRARSILHRPVRLDPEKPYALDLAALRNIEWSLRTATGEEAARLLGRKLQLEESVRDQSRHARGGGSSAPAEVALRGVLEGLEGIALYEFGIVDDDLWLVKAGPDGLDARPVASYPNVAKEMEWHRFAMRRLARGRGDADQADKSAAKIDSWLFGDLTPNSEQVVIVPPPELYAFSWSALPSLRDLPVVVSPSAQLWAARGNGTEDRKDGVVLTGPDLEEAETEAREVAAVYGQERTDIAPSEVAEALTALDGAGVAHVACHAKFVFENPMFSSLRLADGDLHVYDLQQIEIPPGIVVLSACDSGFSQSHPGEELLGLTSALLSLGTRTIVAGVGLVPDTDATGELMVRFHRELSNGVAAATALREAQRAVAARPGGYVAAASFLCIGAG